MCLEKGENRTDLRVMLHHLNDPAKRDEFRELCCRLQYSGRRGLYFPESYRTTGVLHVTGVYLNELYYRDLCLTLTDGMITAYDCANFEKEEDNRTYIEENLLYHHRTLPIGGVCHRNEHDGVRDSKNSTALPENCRS